MNYKVYMKKVDMQLAKMTAEEKHEWIRLSAGSIPEEKREELLSSLGAKITDNKAKQSNCISMDDFLLWYNKIEEGELYFTCYGYEVYGKSHWDGDYIYNYLDPNGLGIDIEEMIKQADVLLAQGEYEPAVKIYEAILTLNYQSYDEGMDEWVPLKLDELAEYGLVHCNIRRFLVNAMYAAFKTWSGEQQMAAILKYLECQHGKDIKLEEMFTVGSMKENEIDLFLERWIGYLKKADGQRAGELLAEAFLFVGGIDCLLGHAKECSKHPGVYWHGCKILLEEEKYVECESLGKEGLEQIPQEFVIRGKIANLLAKAAKVLGHGEIVEQACLEAFHSQSTVLHYLKLFEFDNYKELTDKGAGILDKISGSDPYSYSGYQKERQINMLSASDKSVIRFFHGEFDKIYEKCRKNNEYLGWSDNIKGLFVPLFILLLKKDDTITKVGNLLLKSIADEIGFEEGEGFGDFFLLWKQHIHLTDEQYQKYQDWLEDEVEKRTEAVVGGGYRKNYYKAARLIAALGETMESNGRLLGKMGLINHYKDIYSKKSAFKAEVDEL